MTNAHTYPSAHQPGTHWATDEAWQILDILPVGQLTDDQRFMLCGLIAGTLMWAASPQGAVSGELLHAARAAYHALESYAHGNSAEELAAGVAATLKTALERVGVIS